MTKKSILRRKEADLRNPFEIKSDVILTGNRSASNTFLQQLIEKVRELPVSKELSIIIPKSVAGKASSASNLVLALKRAIAKNTIFPDDFTITMRTFKDDKGNYLNTRIWRIN